MSPFLLAAGPKMADQNGCAAFCAPWSCLRLWHHAPARGLTNHDMVQLPEPAIAQYVQVDLVVLFRVVGEHALLVSGNEQRGLVCAIQLVDWVSLLSTFETRGKGPVDDWRRWLDGRRSYYRATLRGT